MGRFVMNNVVAKGEMTAKEYKTRFGNAMYSINVNGDILIKDCKIGMNGYNCIEIGLKTGVEPPKKIEILNCDFSGTLINNGILVFATQDNATITIKGCHFANLSNVLRLSNRTNATNVTVNIEDCTVDVWESDPTYAGFLILEDYTSKNMDEFAEANRFGRDKFTINIKNLTHAGKRVNPAQIEAYLNCHSANQIAYLYIDNVPADYRYPEYDSNIFPEFNIK